MNYLNRWLNNSMTFEQVLLEAIDEGLACLGEEAKQAVYLHLKTNYALDRQDIPYRIEDFAEAIEETFQAGAGLLEIKIMKNLFAKVGNGYVSLESPESLEFTSYVYALRNSGFCSSLSYSFCQPQKKCGL